MKTKICLVILSAMIVLSGPVYGQRSTVVGPNSTVVIPQTKLQTNHIEGKVGAYSRPFLTVRGDSYFQEASGQPGFAVKDTTMTFRVTPRTKFPDGKEKDIREGIPVTVTFLGVPGPGPAEAESVRIPRKRGVIGSGDSDETDRTRGATLVFNNFNDESVQNKPYRTTAFTVNKSTVITSIKNYHWNDRRGAAAGEIWLVDQKGRKYGPWGASGEPGALGVQSAYWVVWPNIKIGAGTYTIHDSDPATWSQNPRSLGAGLSQVEGYSDEPPKVTSPQPPQTPPSPPLTPPSTTVMNPPTSTPAPPATTTKTTPPSTHTPPATATKTSTPPPPATTTQTQGGAWYLEGPPRIEKNTADLVNTAAYFNRSMDLADGSATGAMSWADTIGDKCKGTYTGHVTWTKPPASMMPGSSLTFKASSKTSANNTCGYKNIGSGIFLKGGGLYLSVTDAAPQPPATFTVPKGSPGSKLIIEAFAKTANIGGKVTYTYVYK